MPPSIYDLLPPWMANAFGFPPSGKPRPKPGGAVVWPSIPPVVAPVDTFALNDFTFPELVPPPGLFPPFTPRGYSPVQPVTGPERYVVGGNLHLRGIGQGFPRGVGGSYAMPGDNQGFSFLPPPRPATSGGVPLTDPEINYFFNTGEVPPPGFGQLGGTNEMGSSAPNLSLDSFLDPPLKELPPSPVVGPYQMPPPPRLPSVGPPAPFFPPVVPFWTPHPPAPIILSDPIYDADGNLIGDQPRPPVPFEDFLFNSTAPLPLQIWSWFSDTPRRHFLPPQSHPTPKPFYLPGKEPPGYVRPTRPNPKPWFFIPGVSLSLNIFNGNVGRDA